MRLKLVGIMLVFNTKLHRFHLKLVTALIISLIEKKKQKKHVAKLVLQEGSVKILLITHTL